MAVMIIVDGDEGEPNQRPGLTACRHAGFVDEGWGGREDMYIILLLLLLLLHHFRTLKGVFHYVMQS